MGNPGTGKTTVARLMGKILFERGALFGDTFKFVEVSESDLLSGYVNQTTTQTLAKLEEARGGVLFIDEAYSLDRRVQMILEKKQSQQFLNIWKTTKMKL